MEILTLPSLLSVIHFGSKEKQVLKIKLQLEHQEHP
jgi:hypothetical protein